MQGPHDQGVAAEQTGDEEREQADDHTEHRDEDDHRRVPPSACVDSRFDIDAGGSPFDRPLSDNRSVTMDAPRRHPGLTGAGVGHGAVVLVL